MREIRIAKPYAQALYSAATEQDILDRIVADVNQILQLTQESEDFDQFLTNPILSPQFKSEMFQQLSIRNCSSAHAQFPTLASTETKGEIVSCNLTDVSGDR